MSDTAIVYVTRTGNCRYLAETLGAMIKAPVFEIVDLKARGGLLRFILGGAQSSMKASSPIKDPGVPMEGLRTVVLVQPIWASNLCPPLRTWIKAHKEELAGKRLALLGSHLGSIPEKFRATVELEFGALAAFACILEKIPQEQKKSELEAFASQL